MVYINFTVGSHELPPVCPPTAPKDSLRSHELTSAWPVGWLSEHIYTHIRVAPQIDMMETFNKDQLLPNRCIFLEHRVHSSSTSTSDRHRHLGFLLFQRPAPIASPQAPGDSQSSARPVVARPEIRCPPHRRAEAAARGGASPAGSTEKEVR